jgi:phenylacetate-CoA ligase
MHSALAEITWPALLKGQAAQLAATLYQLEQSQWWSPEELAQVQHPQQLALLTHALQTVPYYQQRYAALGLGTDAKSLLEGWASLPILTRTDVQEAGEALRSTAIPATHEAVAVVQTSGSTGHPIQVWSTGLTRFFWQAFTIREHLWRRRDVSGKLVAIRPDRQGAPGGVTIDSWGPPMDLLFTTGPSALLHSSTAINAQVSWLREQQPTYLLSLPTNLQALAEACRAGGVALPSLREVRSYGETLRPALRQQLQETWGVPVTDVYSAQEVGYIALQCPEAEHYHLQSEHLVIEILDEAGQPCGSGAIGRVVLTTLMNFASPLIRYALGDYVEVGPPCGCGRGLPVIRRILGRERNLIMLPDGRRHWPSFPEHDWMPIAPIRQLQLVQKTLHHIEARIVAPRALTEQEQARLTNVLNASLGYPFLFTFTYHDTLARGKNGKFEDFVSELSPPIHNQ